MINTTAAFIFTFFIINSYVLYVFTGQCGHSNKIILTFLFSNRVSSGYMMKELSNKQKSMRQNYILMYQQQGYISFHENVYKGEWTMAIGVIKIVDIC